MNSEPSMIWVVQYVGNLAWHQNIDRNINNIPTNVGNVTIPEASGTATVPVQCLAGDSGQPLGRSETLNGLPGFRSFNGGQLEPVPAYSWDRAGSTSMETNTNGSYNGFQTGASCAEPLGPVAANSITPTHTRWTFRTADNAQLREQSVRS